MPDEEILPTLHENRDGQTQLRRHWKADAPVAAVLGVHGISEHSGRYGRVGEALRASGLDLLMFDHQGHGQSGGPRGYIESYDKFFDDIEDLLHERRELGLPVVLLGHSLGGLIIGTYLLTGRVKPDLVVLSAPAFESSHSKFDRRLASFMNKVAPRVFVRRETDPTILSRDPAVQEAWNADPLVLRGTTGRLAANSFKAMAHFANHSTDVTLPTYVLHGSADALAPPAVASANLAELDNVTYRQWPSMRHECFNELGSEQVLDEMIDWIVANLARKDTGLLD